MSGCRLERQSKQIVIEAAAHCQVGLELMVGGHVKQREDIVGFNTPEICT